MMTACANHAMLTALDVLDQLHTTAIIVKTQGFLLYSMATGLTEYVGIVRLGNTMSTAWIFALLAIQVENHV